MNENRAAKLTFYSDCTAGRDATIAASILRSEALVKHLQPARAGLDKIAAALLRGTPPEEAPLIGWPLACGAHVAEKTRAIAFDAGVLTVEVPDARWRDQLRDLAPNYLRALNQIVESGAENAVQRIEFVLRARPTTEMK